MREFLTSRRAKITPEQAGLRTYGDHRRVPGLRREEVALLAGSVSTTTRASSVATRVASRRPSSRPSRARFSSTRPSGHTSSTSHAQRTQRPARVGARRSSACDPACSACWTRSPPRRRSCETGAWTSSPPTASATGSTPSISTARTGLPTRRALSSSTRALDFYVDWEQVATDAVAILRSEAGRDPYDRDLSDLVGELSTRSETFRTRWAAHNVRFHDTGFKRFHHPVVGDLELRRASSVNGVRISGSVAVRSSGTSASGVAVPALHASPDDEALGAITSRISPRAGDDGGHDRSRRATRGRALPARSVRRRRQRG